MARLLRKKPASIKKKRKEADEPASAGRNNTAGEPAAAAAEEEKRKPAQAPAKFISKSKPVAVKRDKNFIDKSVQFLREVKVELKKVSWPTRKQTFGSTMVMLVLVMVVAFFLGVVDIVLSSVIRAVLH